MIKKLLFISAVLVACQSETGHQNAQSEAKANPQQSSESKIDIRSNLNISILIDLSDRIDPLKYPNTTMEYYQRDTGYIASIVKAFNSHVLNKKLILINDRIQTFIDPLPQNPSIVKNLDALRVELNKDNVTKEVLRSLPANYTANSFRLYEEAIRDKNYIGSDTWRFFKSSIKDYCIKQDYHNVLVVLTDGYIYHENSIRKEGNRTTNIGKSTFTQLGLTSAQWQSKMDDNDIGFIPATTDLTGLKVIVLGLNPSPDNPYEEDVLKAFWGKWLTEMGVTDFLIKPADLPGNLDESIQKFILSN